MIFLSFIASFYFFIILCRLTLFRFTLNFNRKKLVITVEGNVGSGKSTMIKILKDAKLQNQGICIVDEPVQVWKYTGILEKYYSPDTFLGRSLARPIYEFQSFAVITHDNSIQTALQKYDIIITERCPETHSKVFFDLYKEQGLVDAVQTAMYNVIMNMVKTKPDAMIYLETDIDNSLTRIKERGRPEEANISRNYISQVHDKHLELVDNFNGPILRIDANYNKHHILQEILDFIHYQ